MKTNDIRKSYLDFFEGKKHKIRPSDSLVPENDPTLLFTGAGMNQFKDYFLGLKKDMTRAASSQKCLRTGDLDNVGKTPYHHSFFEMLGNFSFGDYFKEEAIEWAWEYLTRVLKIPAERLRVSVHTSDQEAYDLWKNKIKIRPEWIYRLGDKSNFWPANAPQDGPNGPCGPCSEIYFDQGKEELREGEDPEDIESRRFAEIWNLVFTQFDRQAVNTLVPLATKNIDTGMGLERLACVLQGKKTNFEIDIFQPILKSIETVLKIQRTPLSRSSLYAIADHVRASAFAISDGVIPSNDGRGYVIRKIIRRALWHAHQLSPERKLEKPLLYRILPSVVETMGKAYPELKEAERSIEATLKGDEERFLTTLETGLKILKQRLAGMAKKKGEKVPGEIVFELYDTYGFPDELTHGIALEHGFEIDQKGFEKLMEAQRARAKKASQIADSIFVSTDLEKKMSVLPATQFLGYEKISAESKVLFAEIQAQQGIVVLAETPFYAESGGQVGDQGMLSDGKNCARVVDTQKKGKVILHYFDGLKGNFKIGQTVKADVDALRRADIMRNHTATHLLHAALRKILGPQVRQLGSLVAPDRLRFDYSYSQALSPQQIQEIEDAVNQEILNDTEVVKEEKDLEAAKKSGAVAFFGEKYGDRVRIVDVPGFSKEFCGGTHCSRTGEIGSFLIVGESSVASGTRRIEALTGKGALQYGRQIRKQLAELSQELKTTPSQLNERIQKMKQTIKKLEKSQGQSPAAGKDIEKIIQDALKVGNFRFVFALYQELAVNELRALSDQLKTRSEDILYFLVSEAGDKFQFLVGRSQGTKKKGLDLRELMRELSPLLGTSGGGRPDLVQGGGRSIGSIAEKQPDVTAVVEAFLKKHA